MSAVEIRKVSSHRDLKRFVRFPFILFRNNPHWVPPIISDELRALSKDFNPVFEYCEAEYWLAFKDGKTVGRIGGILNFHEIEKWNEKVARFGWFDFIDDNEVSGALVDTVKKWAQEKGMESLQGPMGFTNMDSEGMLIEGFNEMSSLSAIYNFPYYVEHMERLGFEKSADMIQFEIKVPKEVPDKVLRLNRLVLEKYNLHLLKPKSISELKPYIRKMFLLYNESFHDLYGFTALTDKQIEYFAKKYISIIRPDLISFVIDKEDNVVGFGIAMPNISKALQKSGGRLYPFGFLHILRELKRSEVVQLYLVGVKPEYQGKGLLAMVYLELHATFIRSGFKYARTQPQLEDNLKATSIWKNYESRVNIKRRIWRTDLISD